MNVKNLIGLAIYMESGSQWSSKIEVPTNLCFQFPYERDLDVFGKWKVTPFAISLTN